MCVCVCWRGRSYQGVFVLLGQQLRLVALDGDLSQPLSHLGQPVQHLYLVLAKEPSVSQRLFQQAGSPGAPLGQLRVTRPDPAHPFAQPVAIGRTAQRDQRLAEGLEAVDLGFAGRHLLLERLGSVCVCVRARECVYQGRG